ncbi:MAG: hypothetical protein MPW16_20235 [Candidatus Manganitrophus sp.]|nr:MAG: hypothetical protein MPW16_20235 [Candidatus Manganitrophus sp.]
MKSNQSHMQTRYLYLGILLIGLLMGPNACSMRGKVQIEEVSSPALQISAVMSKTKIKVGEPIEISCIIENSSNTAVTARPSLYGFPSDYIRFFDPDQMEMDSGFSEFPEAKLERDSYVRLNPGNQVTLRFMAVFRGPNRPEVPVPLKSFIVDIDKSSIFLRGGYNYSVRCQFQQDEDELETSKRFGIENLWVGRIISDPIELTIQE